MPGGTSCRLDERACGRIAIPILSPNFAYVIHQTGLRRVVARSLVVIVIVIGFVAQAI